MNHLNDRLETMRSENRKSEDTVKAVFKWTLLFSIPLAIAFTALSILACVAGCVWLWRYILGTS